MRRTGGREEEEEDGADTELKTKTPHVNVGKTIKTEFCCYIEGVNFHGFAFPPARGSTTSIWRGDPRVIVVPSCKG